MKNYLHFNIESYKGMSLKNLSDNEQTISRIFM